MLATTVMILSSGKDGGDEAKLMLGAISETRTGEQR
jgi:hypothetical protein